MRTNRRVCRLRRELSQTTFLKRRRLNSMPVKDESYNILLECSRQRAKAVRAIVNARDRYAEKWSQEHDDSRSPEEWVLILTERISNLSNNIKENDLLWDLQNTIAEIGALSIAAYEYFDRREEPVVGS